MASISPSAAAFVAFEPQSLSTNLRDQRVRATLWVSLIFWCSNFFLLTLGTALSGNRHWPAIGSMRLVTMLLGLFFCFLIHLLLDRLPTTRKRLIALAIVAPVAAEVFAWAVYFGDVAIDPTLRLQTFNWSNAVRTVTFWTWFFIAWAGVYLAISYSFDVQSEQELAAKLREQAHAAQLRALHSQINPHFLFNSLNSVSALILDGQVALADEMVSKLAQFLRLGLAADPTTKIPLSTELELQRTYLSIEQLRYQDLKVSFDVPADLRDALVPALILQPIVENAVKFGVASAPPPASIELLTWREGTELHIRVTDSGNGIAAKRVGSGIGLSNIQQRLVLIYGEDRVKLQAAKLANGSFEAHLKFPLELG